MKQPLPFCVCHLRDGFGHIQWMVALQQRPQIIFVFRGADDRRDLLRKILLYNFVHHVCVLLQH